MTSTDEQPPVSDGDPPASDGHAPALDGPPLVSVKAPQLSGNQEEEASVEESEWEEIEITVPADPSLPGDGQAVTKITRVAKKKPKIKTDAVELRLQGRRAICKRIADIALICLRRSNCVC